MINDKSNPEINFELPENVEHYKVDLVPYEKKENSISINIWDDYHDDEFIPDGRIQETYAYVEEDVDDEICCACLSILKAYLDDIDELKENGVKVELVFYDSAEKYPNFVGTAYEYYLYKRWELRFKHLSHERRYKLVEMLSLANLEYKGNSFNIYSES